MEAAAVKKRPVQTLRELRLSLPMPPTLEMVAEFVRRYGRRCTAGHLSAVECGHKRGGPQLLAVLAQFYGCDRAFMESCMDHTMAEAQVGLRAIVRKRRT